MPSARSFHALHVDQSVTLTIDLPLSQAMALFTPEGKRAWLTGWQPEFLHRSEDDGVDTAFRTVQGGEETLWMVLSHDLEEGSLGYARMIPGSRMGTLMLDGEAIDDTSCWVTVTEEATALTPAGNVLLRERTEQVFGDEVSDWGVRIAKCSSRGHLTPR